MTQIFNVNMSVHDIAQAAEISRCMYFVNYTERMLWWIKRLTKVERGGEQTFISERMD